MKKAPARRPRLTGRAPSLATRLRAVPRALQPYIDRVASTRDIWSTAAEPLDAARVAETILEHVDVWLPLDGWAVYADEWTGDPRLLASTGLGGSALEAAKALAHRVLHAGVDDTRRRGDPAHGMLVAIPLAARGRVLAALIGIDRSDGADQAQMPLGTRRALIEALEPFVLSLDTALRMQRAEALSVTDDLTQLYNSRFLALVLRRESKRSIRSRRPLALLFLDLDGFKDVNDTYGHVAGSRTLAEAADLLRQCARESDIVVRYGGDEFAVVLPDTDTAGALLVAQRILERVSSHTFLASDGAAVHLSASVGVSVLPLTATTGQALIETADEAMYWVKAHGKNGIHVAPHHTDSR